MVHGVSPLLIEILAGINQQDTPLLLSLRTPEITITLARLVASIAPPAAPAIDEPVQAPSDQQSGASKSNPDNPKPKRKYKKPRPRRPAGAKKLDPNKPILDQVRNSQQGHPQR